MRLPIYTTYLYIMIVRMILTNIFLRCPVKNRLLHYSLIIVRGCSTISHDSNKNSQSVPEEMPASKYVGQGFQPKAEKCY